MTMTASSLLSVLLLFSAVLRTGSVLMEEDRRAEYAARNHTWPPNKQDYLPDTDGWRAIFERRFRQVDALDNALNSYNGYMGVVYAGLVCPNFTENGWGLTRAPQGLLDELKASLHRGLDRKDSLPVETEMFESIETPNRPIFIHQPSLNQAALRVIRPIAEAWSGAKLIGSSAYGLRVYRNESVLNMHLDKVETHVISAIMHVGHDSESEPWPLVIEDFHGNTNEVVLAEGDVLLYESSKCLHGRPKPFDGSWYSSLFIHYYPVDWEGQQLRMDTHYRVPPIWNERVPTNVEELKVIDTSLKEPECEHAWCALSDSVKWSGPAEAYGKVQSAGVTTELDLPSEEEIVELGAAYWPKQQDEL